MGDRDAGYWGMVTLRRRGRMVFVLDIYKYCIYIWTIHNCEVSMNTNTVNISFRKDLLRQIDRVAKEESRTRSELIREAARMYIERKNRWKNIFEYGSKVAEENGLTEEDVMKEISEYRKSRKASS